MESKEFFGQRKPVERKLLKNELMEKPTPEIKNSEIAELEEPMKKILERTY